MKLLEATRKANRGALVAEVALDLPGDRQRREGREFVAEVRVEAFDRFDQAEVTDLRDVLERLTAIGELARQEVHEVVVVVDEPSPDEVALGGVGRLPVPAMQRPQLFARKPRGTGHYLIVIAQRGTDQPARCLTIRNRTCPVRGSMTGRKSSTKQRIIS